MKELNAPADYYIKSYKGIEQMTGLEKLYTESNDYSGTLDLSNNTKLKSLEVGVVHLESIDLSDNTELEFLRISYTENMKNIDLGEKKKLKDLRINNNEGLESINLSGLPELTNLKIVGNISLESADLSSLKKLENLDISGNKLKSLDVSQNTALKSLFADKNELSSIDLKNNKALEKTGFAENKIGKIDLSNNTELKNLYLNGCGIDSIDLSKNTKLENLYLDKNKLKELNVEANTGITHLSAADNELETINLNNNENIEMLDLRNNKFEDIRCQHNYRANYVDLSGNRFPHIFLGFFPNLKPMISELIDMYSDSSFCVSAMPFDAGKQKVYAAFKKEPDGKYSFNLKNLLKEYYAYFMGIVETPGVSFDSETGKVTIDSGLTEFKYRINTNLPDDSEIDSKFRVGEAAAIYARLLEDGDGNVTYTKKSNFSDIKDGAWYEKYVHYMAEKGIMNGYEDGSFRPEASITRAELSKLIAAKIAKDGVKTDFTDIAGHWAENSIEKAYAEGVVNGYPDKTFRPDANVTRAEAAKMFNVFFFRGVNEEGLKNLDNPLALITFFDVPKEHWAY